MKTLPLFILVACLSLTEIRSSAFKWNEMISESLQPKARLQTSQLKSQLPANTPDWITEAGGVVIRDRAGHITGVDLRSSWVSDSDLPQLAEFPYLTHLDLSLTRITDHGLQQLKKAPGIVDLNLYYAEQITDEGMAAVK